MSEKKISLTAIYEGQEAELPPLEVTEEDTKKYASQLAFDEIVFEGTPQRAYSATYAVACRERQLLEVLRRALTWQAIARGLAESGLLSAEYLAAIEKYEILTGVKLHD